MLRLFGFAERREDNMTMSSSLFGLQELFIRICYDPFEF